MKNKKGKAKRRTRIMTDVRTQDMSRSVAYAGCCSSIMSVVPMGLGLGLGLGFMPAAARRS
eukprot:3896783-Prymnesium_polylepis.2